MRHLLAAIVIAVLVAPGGQAAAQPATPPDAAARAEHLMREAMEVIRLARGRSAAGSSDEARTAAIAGLDAARAALIGAELTALMTTLGSLESKRLATDPRWAGVLVRQFSARGIGSGAAVLASFSGSFPGLNLAVMAACRALGVRLIAISSVTASTWGANEPGFTWPEMEAMVVAAGALPPASVAVSLGGSRDAARDLSEDGREIARRIQRDTARALGAPGLSTTTLEEAVARRLETYRSSLGASRPATYVNVGGNHASLGGAGAAFRREEGWLTPSSAPSKPPAPASVTQAWLAEGVPVLNLLDVKALARAWGM